MKFNKAKIKKLKKKPTIHILNTFKIKTKSECERGGLRRC